MELAVDVLADLVSHPLFSPEDVETEREVVLEEILLLWLANRNPAFEPFRELFDDDEDLRTS